MRPGVTAKRPESALFRVGTEVALSISMSTRWPAFAAMVCPVCARLVEPTADSTWIVAWYSCRRCGAEWSARIRDGRPAVAGEDGTFGTGAEIR